MACCWHLRLDSYGALSLRWCLDKHTPQHCCKVRARHGISQSACPQVCHTSDSMPDFVSSDKGTAVLSWSICLLTTDMTEGLMSHKGHT